ncbi:MAG: sugar ABC transporter substrate-binding protein [Nitrososphaerota archaeon]|nr:sugar ABC transporter substrate-binding protein [Nitrososphaerota archaeon]
MSGKNVVSRRSFIKYGVAIGAAAVAVGVGLYYLPSLMPAEKKNLIPYVNKTRGALFFVAIESALGKRIKELGYEFEVMDAKGDAVLFNEHLETAAAKRPIAITCNPIDSNAQAFVIARIRKDLKVPVGIADTPCEATQIDATVVFDNFKGGRLAGLKAVEILEKRYGSLDGLRVVTFHGYLGSDAWRKRMEGFDSVMEEHPEIIYDKVPMTDETASADITAKNADIYLSKHPDVKCMNFASEGPWLEATYGVMEAKGLLYHRDHEKHITMVGVDGYPNTFRRIIEGIYDVSSAQDPLFYGEALADVMNEFCIPGREVPSEYEYPHTEKYAWGKGGLNLPAKVSMERWGPTLYQPNYAITAENVWDSRHWGVRVVTEYRLWDPITERSYKIQGAPAELPEWQKLFGFSAPEVRPSWV